MNLERGVLSIAALSLLCAYCSACENVKCVSILFMFPSCHSYFSIVVSGISHFIFIWWWLSLLNSGLTDGVTKMLKINVLTS